MLADWGIQAIPFGLAGGMFWMFKSCPGSHCGGIAFWQTFVVQFAVARHSKQATFGVGPPMTNCLSTARPPSVELGLHTSRTAFKFGLGRRGGVHFASAPKDSKQGVFAASWAMRGTSVGHGQGKSFEFCQSPVQRWPSHLVCDGQDYRNKCSRARVLAQFEVSLSCGRAVGVPRASHRAT